MPPITVPPSESKIVDTVQVALVNKSEGDVPNRSEIQAKLTQIKKDPTFSTIQSDLVKRVSEWLDSYGCPPEDKAKILDDLDSYR